MKAPQLRGQQKTVYDYIKAHPHTTIREIRNANRIMKPCMRVSEINYLWREQNGIDHSTGLQLIVTVGRNDSKEALKAIAKIRPRDLVTA